MPNTLPISPDEARKILASRQRQAEARKRTEQELDGMVTSIEESRKALEAKLQDYVAVCDQLRQASRRLIGDESSHRYRTYATMQLRLAGAMSQAIKRSDTGSRILTSSKREQEEREKREEAERLRQEARAAERHVRHSLLPPHDDDFESLYGTYVDEEGWTDA